MGKVAILMLTMGRVEMTRKTWAHNLNNAGCEFDLFWWDNGSTTEDLWEMAGMLDKYGDRVKFTEYSDNNVGIAKALNAMIRQAYKQGYDYFMTMANDILEPENWLRDRVGAAQKIENTAVVAIPPSHTGVTRYKREGISGIKIDNGQVIGNWLITRLAVEKIGYYNESYGNYAPLDLDYCDRCAFAKLKTYYLSDMTANHIGDPAQNPKDYQEAKEQSLRESWPKYTKNVSLYRMGINIYQNEEKDKEN